MTDKLKLQIKGLCSWTRNQRVLFWLFLGTLILPNVIMLFTESTSLLTRFTGVVLPFALYWLVYSMWKKPGKPFWWLFIFVFFAAFEIVLLFLFGESPIAVDMFLNLTTTNISEVNELLTGLISAIVFVCLVYVPCMILAVMSIRNKEVLSDNFRKNQRRNSSILLFLGLFMLLINYANDNFFVFRNDIFPFNACYNLGLSVDRVIRTNDYATTSANFTYGAQSERADSVNEVYVLVIGEALRADNMRIYGYERNTTPNMSALVNDSSMVVYRDAITMSNTTHKSVPMLLSGVASEAFDSIYYRKSIITAFKEAGFKTAYYSNQSRNRSFIEFFGNEADDVVFLKDNVVLTDTVPDMELTSLLRQRLAAYDGGKLFVVLHCYGSHFNYNDRYPKEMARYKPDVIPSAKRKYRVQLVNAYDNSALQTDEVVHQVVLALSEKQVNSAMIFASDHGEDLFDDSRGRFLHASPQPTYYQLRVPLCVWCSPQYRQTYAKKWEAINSTKEIPVSTNKVIFHTLLDMAGISTPSLLPNEALSSGVFEESERMYVNDHNELLPLRRSGLKNEDFHEFETHRLKY